MVVSGLEDWLDYYILIGTFPQSFYLADPVPSLLPFPLSFTDNISMLAKKWVRVKRLGKKLKTFT